MNGAMFLRAAGARCSQVGARWGLVVLGLLSGCALPERALHPVRYDLGVGTVAPAALSPGPPADRLPALAISVQAAPVLDGTAMRYRLAYADALQPRAYTLARWVMPPAELVQQRLRELLSQQYAVRQPGEGAARVLQIELEEFSQLFDAPGQSTGLLRLRATVLQTTSGGTALLAQRRVELLRPAASADAAGGARALTAATDAAAAELAQWLQTLP